MAGRFPYVPRCVRDFLMITGSSVAFELAFSDSCDIVSTERAAISDTNICELMKLCGWVDSSVSVIKIIFRYVGGTPFYLTEFTDG